MYTWGYIKEATLAKMDLTVNQAISMGLLNKMPFYANEAVTQITASVKAKRCYMDYKVRYEDAVLKAIKLTYQLDDLDFLFDTNIDKSTLTENQLLAYETYYKYTYTEKPVSFNDDFFAWSDDIVYKYCDGKMIPASDFDYTTFGSKQIIFKTAADYKFPYLAKWFKILPTTDDNELLDAPDDIIEAIPSYIASQLYKIDDETKSAILRNEFEMALARIDENDYSTNKTIAIGGDW